MILITLVNFILALLYNVVLFFVGIILTDAKQLRNYLGLKSPDEQVNDYSKTAYWIENIGKVLMIIAVGGALILLVSTTMVLSKMV